MKSKILLVIGAAVLVLSVLFTIKSCEKREFDEKVDKLKRENSEGQRRIDSLRADSVRLMVSLSQSKARNDSSSEAFKMRISALSKKLASVSLRNASVKQLDSVRFILAPGSSDTSYCQPIDAARIVLENASKLPIVQEQLLVTSSRVLELSSEKTEQASQYDSLLNNASLTLSETRDINSRLNETVDLYRKDAKKKSVISFGEKILYGVIGIGVGAALFR